MRAAYPQAVAPLLRLKARWLGVEQLRFWDRNAPLPSDDDREIPWAEAQATVLDRLSRLLAGVAAVGEQFFDAALDRCAGASRQGAGRLRPSDGAERAPYLLLNYQGKPRDVMTLAHELGHGVHQVLAARQGALMADTPLTLAETAWVFGEMLTFRALVARETDPARRKIMLAARSRTC